MNISKIIIDDEVTFYFGDDEPWNSREFKRWSLTWIKLKLIEWLVI